MAAFKRQGSIHIRSAKEDGIVGRGGILETGLQLQAVTHSLRYSPIQMRSNNAAIKDTKCKTSSTMRFN